MKRLILLSLILAFAANVNAQTSDKKWGIAGGMGAYGSLKNGNIGVAPELYLSRYLSPKFDIMLKGNLGVLNTDVTSFIDLANPFINLRYKLSDETKKFRPYLYGGPGFLADNSTSGVNFDLGLGGKYYLKDNLAVYGNAGYVNGIKSVTNNNKPDNFWKVTFGLELDLGKTIDSDMDGVSDGKDKCPNTPAGVGVDSNGCPVDSDNDGVADYIDDCPTEAGLTSLKGCPDKDKDGIADKNDACPDVAGVASLKGCPDGDSDGISDKEDRCPNTPANVSVDNKGCPKDTDGDGFFDFQDNCPTIAGTLENKGCPAAKEAKETKEINSVNTETEIIKLEPVYFESGLADFSQAEKGKIDQLVNILKANSNYNVNIVGNTDNKGDEQLNMNLSENRIDAVVKAILASGIKFSQIASKKAFGSTKPVASNDTPEGCAKNRRVEFEIFKSK